MIMATFIEHLLCTWLHAVCFTCVTPLVLTPTFRTAGHGHTLRAWVTDHHHMPSASSQGRVRVTSPGGLPSYSVICRGKAEARYPENELFIQHGWEEERRIPFHRLETAWSLNLSMC